MKKLNILLAATVAVSSLAYAGGDILPLELEEEEVYVPVEEYIAPVVEPIPEPIPEPVAKPVVVTPQPVVVTPTPVVESILPLGLYVAAGLVGARYDPNCGCAGKGDTDSTAGLMGRVGYDFNEYVGLEGRGMRTNWKSEGGKLKHAGLFLKPMYPVSNDFNLYGLAGYAKTTTEGTTRRRVDAETFAWGGGLEYDLGSDKAREGRYSRVFDGYGDQEHGWGLFADYERLVQKSGSPDLDTVSAGITYDF